MELTKKYYYAFVYEQGKKTTCGSPNEKTGRMSIAGYTEIFDSYEKRKQFVLNNDSAESVTVKELRKLNLGMSIKDFGEYLKYIKKNLLDEIEIENLMEFTKKLKRQIENEVSTWNYEEFTNATFDRIVQNVIYRLEDGYTLEEAYQYTNDAIAEGNL